jgi:hypothetical protein
MMSKKGATRAEAFPQDPYAVEGVGVENVEATFPIHHHLREVRPSDDGADDERESTRARDMPWVVLAAKRDRNL